VTRGIIDPLPPDLLAHIAACSAVLTAACAAVDRPRDLPAWRALCVAVARLRRCGEAGAEGRGAPERVGVGDEG
jgi:hypothetical protein